jgi:uncharacterized protein
VDEVGLNFLLLACAFAMGFLVPRGTTCAVAAVREVLDKKKAWRFGGFALAALTSVVVLLPLGWSHALPVKFAPHIELGGLVVLGGLLFGIGATINGACVFGTLTKVVGGNLSYFFVVPGLWLGAVTIGVANLQLAPRIVAGNELEHFSWTSGLAWCVAFALLLGGLGWFARGKRLNKAALMCGIGLVGGLLYTLHMSWNYNSVVHDFAQQVIMSPARMMDGLLPWLVGTACFGGFVSTVLAGNFKLTRPKFVASAGALVGGFMMAFGVAMMPGGNDGLVLFLIPSLVPAGFIAYLAMNIGIALMLGGERFIAKRANLGSI